MSAFALKIIAMVTMFIDHLFASCIDPYGVDVWNISRHIVPGTGTTLYWIGRMIGRIAFPIFCFQIVEGVRYTKNWKRYMARLALLALISEIPFVIVLAIIAVMVVIVHSVLLMEALLMVTVPNARVSIVVTDSVLITTTVLIVLAIIAVETARLRNR